MNDLGRWRWPSAGDEVAFVRRVLIVLAIGTLAFIAYRLGEVLLLAFGAVLVAVILRALAGFIAQHTPVPDRWSLLAAGIAALAFLGLAGLLFGSQLGAQVGELGTALPNAVNAALARFGIENAQAQFPQLVSANLGRDVIGRLASFSATFVGGLADFLVVVVTGIFLALDPALYRRGLVKLFPHSQQERVDEVLGASGNALALWLKGQVIAMTLVGALVALGLWLIGMPSPLALGLIAGLCEFIPFLGAFLGAMPAIVIAMTQGGSTVLWTIVVFVVVQQIESNLIAPLVQRRTVELPPALSLMAVLAFGVLLGPLGLVLAVPLTVVAYVLVKKLYVRETLGEETSVPGESEASDRPAEPGSSAPTATAPGTT